jgi:hypothetical protein
MPGFMDGDPYIPIECATERGKEFVVLVDLRIEAATVVGRAQSGAGSGPPSRREKSRAARYLPRPEYDQPLRNTRLCRASMRP